MSAPSIPNLLFLRGSRGGGSRGRGRDTAGRGPAAAHSHDLTVQGTDTDAAVSRLSAVHLGYMDDPYAQYFVQNPDVQARRLPIINRGTYTRTSALDRLVFSFLARETGDAGKRQIISLGAGTDTRCFRLSSRPGTPRFRYHEVDFPAISAKKLAVVQGNPQLRLALPNAVESTSSWHAAVDSGSEYRCHGVDLRDLLKEETRGLEGLDPDLPTLLVSECCLCYLEIEQAKGVLRHFTDRIPNLAIVLYEPMKPDDPFGRQMVSNLAARGIRMPTLDIYKRASDQETRLREAGFDTAKSMSVEDVWKKWVSPEEKERVDELEGLDEVEEWNLLAGHYVVTWGWRGDGFEGLSSI